MIKASTPPTQCKLATNEAVSPPPPASLQAYHRRISQHLMTLMRTPHVPHSQGRVSPMTALSSSVSTGTGTTGTSGTSGTSGSGSICSSRSRETSATSSKSNEPSKDLPPQSSASASASTPSTSSPDVAQLLTARPNAPHGLGLGNVAVSPVISLSPSGAEEEDVTYEDEEPTPAGPTYRHTLPDQPAPFIPTCPVPATREEEHRIAWDAAGRKVWKALPPNFQLTLVTPKARRGSNEVDNENAEAGGAPLARRKSEDGTPGNTVSVRPATMPNATSLDAFGFDIAIHRHVSEEDNVAVRMGLLAPPRSSSAAPLDQGEPISRSSSRQSQHSALSAGASINVSSRRNTSASASVSPNAPSTTAFSKASLPEVRRSRGDRRSSSMLEKPKAAPLRNVEDELAYEAKLAQRQAKKRSDLKRKIEKWYHGVVLSGEAAIFTPLEILKHIPSPSIASAHMAASPLASAVVLPFAPLAPETAPLPNRLVDIPTMPLHIISDTPAAIERTVSPFQFPRKEKAPPLTSQAARSVELELAIRLQALQALLGDPTSIPRSPLLGANEGREETLKGSARLRNISVASGVSKIDEFGAPLRGRK